MLIGSQSVLDLANLEGGFRNEGYLGVLTIREPTI